MTRNKTEQLFDELSKPVPPHPGICPLCHDNRIASIEVIQGRCDHDEDGEPMGYTDVDWNTTQTIGWQCLGCDNTWGLPRVVAFT
jgi:hypothetical protein